MKMSTQLDQLKIELATELHWQAVEAAKQLKALMLTIELYIVYIPSGIKIQMNFDKNLGIQFHSSYNI